MQIKKYLKMIKLIQRKTDKKYLQSLENDIWVENIKEAYQMTYRECNTIKEQLLNIYNQEQLHEIVDLKKSKPMSSEEIEELVNLLKIK